MELNAVASVVIQKLKDMQPNEITGKTEMEQALEELQGLISCSDKQQAINEEELKSWATKCLENLYCVEDTVESSALRIARQRKKWGFLMNHTLFFNNFTNQKLTRKMRTIHMDTKRLIAEKPKGTSKQHPRCNGSSNLGDRNGGAAENGDTECHNNEDSAINNESDGKFRAMQQKSYTMNPEVRTIDRKPIKCTSLKSMTSDREKHARLLYTHSYDDEELEIVGISKEVHSLVERLKGIAEDDGRGVIVPIAGEKGSGKTTLARAVYANREIKRYFESRCVWLTISKEYNKSDILQNLLKQMGDSKDYSADQTDELPTRVLEHLNSKNYLIVLDDVQSDQWEKLKTVFSYNRNCTLLLTITLNPQEMSSVSLNSTYYVKRLEEKYSWNLFLKKAGWEEDPKHKDLKQQILGVCYSLPLNIVLLGSLLSTKEGDSRLDYLQEILKRQTVLKTDDFVSLSYTDLPDHLKLCVLYLVLFPKEYDIPVRRLLRLWLSEGFVIPKPGIFPEDVVQENFDDLVKRSLIQISKLRSDGSPRRCRLLGVLHDYLLPKAQNIRLFNVHCSTSSGGQVPDGSRRFVEHASGKNIYTGASAFKHLRSYLSFNFQRKDTPAKEVGSLLSRIIGKGFGLLRVLDLEGVYKPSLPENLGELFHLRYLGLRWTFLDALPSSVGDLPYLETLDVKHTNINNLPTSMWKLEHLRHLNLSGTRLDMPKHSDCNSLPKLLTLWGLSVDDESPVENGLKKLSLLREAGITFCLNNCEDLLNWISTLTELQSLRLRSKTDVGHPSDFGKKPLSLSSLSKLSHLNMLGELPKLPVVEHLPQGLKVLTLSLSKLTEDPMPILGKLRKLNVLRLLSDSYVGKEMVCPQGTFEELRVLKLWKLKNLEKWEVKERAMEKLKEINIRCCHELMDIPKALLKRGSLKEVVITNMPKEFKWKVEDKKALHVTLITKDYDFTPLPWEEADHTSDEVQSEASVTNM